MAPKRTLGRYGPKIGTNNYCSGSSIGVNAHHISHLVCMAYATTILTRSYINARHNHPTGYARSVLERDIMVYHWPTLLTAVFQFNRIRKVVK